MANTKTDYSAIIYGGLGFSGSTILIYSAGYNTLAFGCGFIAIWIIDHFARNRLVGFGTAVVTTCLVVEAALVANFPVGPNQNNNALRAAAAMTYLYVVSSSFKRIPLPYYRVLLLTHFTRLLPSYSSTAHSKYSPHQLNFTAH
jgi:hypothetical protein